MSTASDVVFAGLIAFIKVIIPGVTVLKGLQNGIAMPDGGFISLTPLFQSRLGTNVDSFTDPVTVTGTQSMTQSTEFSIQLDFYGITAADWSNIFTTAFRSEYGANNITGCVPLYCDMPKQLQLVDSEENYEQRWCVTAVMQYDVSVTVPMQFFTEATTTIYKA